jgi:hypothetical protein
MSNKNEVPIIKRTVKVGDVELVLFSHQYDVSILGVRTPYQAEIRASVATKRGSNEIIVASMGFESPESRAGWLKTTLASVEVL